MMKMEILENTLISGNWRTFIKMEDREKEKQKKTTEFIANNSGGALEMKKELEKQGYEVHHIYTGSNKPIIINGGNGNFTTGAGNIRRDYGL